MSWGEYTRGERIKVAVSALAILVIVGSFGAVLFAGQPAAPRTDEHGCKLNEPVPSHTLVLVDNTDAFSQSQIDGVLSALGEVRSNLGDWAMVSVFSILDDPPIELFSACSPERVAPPNPWRIFGQPKESWLVRKARFQRNFEKPLSSLIQRLELTRTADHSPILESLTDAIQSLGGYWKDAPHRELIMFSDMMQNTPEFSQYNASGRSRAPDQVLAGARLDLSGAHVTVYYLVGLPHDRGVQENRELRAWHEGFWRLIFESSGATSVEIKELR